MSHLLLVGDQLVFSKASQHHMTLTLASHVVYGKLELKINLVKSESIPIGRLDDLRGLGY